MILSCNPKQLHTDMHNHEAMFKHSHSYKSILGSHSAEQSEQNRDGFWKRPLPVQDVTDYFSRNKLEQTELNQTKLKLH